MGATDRPEPGHSQSASPHVGEELSSDASRLAETAKTRAEQEADTRKSQAARTARSASSALGKAAAELEHDRDAPDWLVSAVRQTSGQIERFASEMEGRDIHEISQQVTSFARRHPGTFLAASAAAGFAAARFLRAGAEYQSHRTAEPTNITNTDGMPSASLSTTPRQRAEPPVGQEGTVI